MTYAKPVAVVLAVLLASGGVAAAVGPAGVGPVADADEEVNASDVSSADVSATLDNGTVTVTVTADGEPVENATVEVNDRELTTDADGTATVALADLDDSADELDVEVDHAGFTGEVSYAVEDGSLDPLKEEYEYESDEESEEESDEEGEEESDEESEEKESDEESEDEESDDDESDDDEEADDEDADEDETA